MLMNAMQTLQEIRKLGVKAWSRGLPDETITEFLSSDPSLGQAIELAQKRLLQIQVDYQDLASNTEQDWARVLQEGLLNFYPAHSVSPYIPLGAKGPWIITLGGAVIYDTGGYGMLGLGHNPDNIRAVLSQDYVMANVMTPSFFHHEFGKAIRRNIGFRRPDKTCPYSQFVCMNSGSEAMAVADRLVDAHTKILTDPGQRYEGRRVQSISFRSSFHGRTTGPARVSDSSRKSYLSHLASFRNLDNLQTVAPNNISELQAAFARADKENIFFQAMLIEPVMGEGNPGLAVTRDFYDVARRLTREHGTLLVVDAIQASLRSHGVLSIVDYPGFEDAEAPDMESYSKALNAGQYPLSVLALRQEAADCYKPGLYGNTMTTNPRALAVASAVLKSLTPELRDNIERRGKEFVEKLKDLGQSLPGMITAVQGTGLLLSAELRQDIPVVGSGAIEERIRKNGVNVIHGGTNSLRFTPHFAINSAEIDLIVSVVRDALLEYR